MASVWRRDAAQNGSADVREMFQERVSAARGRSGHWLLVREEA